jgi:hypothetical protein
MWICYQVLQDLLENLDLLVHSEFQVYQGNLIQVHPALQEIQVSWVYQESQERQERLDHLGLKELKAHVIIVRFLEHHRDMVYKWLF